MLLPPTPCYCPLPPATTPPHTHTQDDVPASSKIREIEKLYARARAAGKKDSKGGKGKKGGPRKGPPLDKRMKMDKRGMQKAMRSKGGKRR